MTLRTNETRIEALNELKDFWRIKAVERRRETTEMCHKVAAIILNIHEAAADGIGLDHVDLVARLTDILGGDNES